MKLLFIFLFSLFVPLSSNFFAYSFYYVIQGPSYLKQSIPRYLKVFGLWDLCVEFYEYHFFGTLSRYHDFHSDYQNHLSCYHLTLDNIKTTAFFSIFLPTINFFIHFVLIALPLAKFILCSFLS